MMLPPDHPLNVRIQLRKELVEEGLDDRAIRRRIRTGALHRVRHGAYVAGGSWRDLDDDGQYAVRCHAVHRQARSQLVLSHVSALPAYDAPLWGLDLGVVHGTRRDGRAGRKEAGVQQHSGLLLDDDVVSLGELTVTSPARTCLDVTMVAPLEAALCVVNHLLHAGLVDHTMLRERYQSTDSVPRAATDPDALRSTRMEHWPGSLRTDLVLRLADGRCESVGESRTLYLCWKHGLPMPEPQYKVRNASGRVVARVDFAWPELGVFLEFDGKVKYADLVPEDETVVDVVVREKGREDLVRELTGWRCVRITWADLRDPLRLVARIKAAFAAQRRAG